MSHKISHRPPIFGIDPFLGIKGQIFPQSLLHWFLLRSKITFLKIDIDEFGFVAQMIDSEGNRVGLHSDY